MDKEKQMINFDLAEIADGRLQSKFDKEMKRVITNLLDPNTDAKKKRSVTVKVTLTPSKKDRLVDIDIDVKSALAPEIGVSTLMMVGRDVNTGEVAANELKSGIPGQTYFDGKDGKVKLDDGTPVEKVEAQEAAKQATQQEDKTNTGVIDFQRKQN